MLRLDINSLVRKKIREISGGETCPRIKTSAKQISFWVRKPKFNVGLFFRPFNGVL